MAQYPLILLSHMGTHLKAAAQCQLEWCCNSLCKLFYNGHSNPMNLSNIRCLSSVKDVETQFVGIPKVVIVTDASLSYGLSKELLIKWGGDPRCSVIFTEFPSPNTLASEIVNVITSKNPCIVQVTRLQRILLNKEELELLAIEQEKQRVLTEELVQRQIRETELALVCM